MRFPDSGDRPEGSNVISYAATWHIFLCFETHAERGLRAYKRLYLASVVQDWKTLLFFVGTAGLQVLSNDAPQNATTVPQVPSIGRK